MKNAILITGGSGFIGSNFIHHMRGTHPQLELINLDILSYSGNPDNLKALKDDSHYRFVQGDIADGALVKALLEQNRVVSVVHFAAESHVDRSILEAGAFVQTNVVGTHVLLENARQYWVETLSRDSSFRFVHISTDEIYGTLGDDGFFSEESPFRPNSPYAATKAAADLLVRAYFETYRLPTLIARPSNNYGPYQFPEKFIPLMITNLMEDSPLPIYGRGINVRDWIFVGDACRAVDLIMHQGVPGTAYNVGGETEKRNIDVAQELLAMFSKDESCLSFVEDRPGHDLRYALNNRKIKDELGWKPTVPFLEGIEQTVAWYKANEWWWKPLKERLTSESRGFWTKS
ncbi:MAG: dTDP-glucose 4,6-dehydratase [Deltaproteobacteria bacterium]|nr:dTDP-glucose 4,6-dehydratase [Deltaproteobacteria bacterium]